MEEFMKQETARTSYRTGLICSFSCAIIWGVLPIYWQALRPIDSWVIILYRIMLVGVCSLIAALKQYGWKGILEPLKRKKDILIYFCAGLVITCNWSIYIWAVNADHVIQTCIGYYMEPLIVCVFGIVLFKEKLTKHKLTAFCFACVGLAVILLYFREIPLIALGLGITFAIYTAIKKSVKAPALLSLLYETIFLVPPALIAIIYLEASGKGAWGTGAPYQYGLLLLCGIFTAVPLVFFANAAKKLPMITMGIMQYISPSIALLLGIFLMEEPFDLVQFLAFVIIWIGLVFFTRGEYLENKSNGEIEHEES